MKHSVFFAFLVPLGLVADELPNAHLLPTTRAIHKLVTQKPALAAKDMRAYTDKVALAGNGEIEMLPIPGGTYLAGSPATEKHRDKDEGPQKTVTIEPFWMAKVETTWNLYRPFMENGAARNKDGTLNRDADMLTSEPPTIEGKETLIDVITQPTPPYQPMHFSMGDGYTKDYPAICVTYHAANKFCEWLSAQTGHFYRLPTEAEWEYACRAGSTTAYHFGDDASKLGDYAWYADNSEFQYQKVGTKKPNPWGLYDMHGNVAELTLDQYVANYFAVIKNGAKGPWNPPIERHPTTYRGGHWDAYGDQLRSANRSATTTKLKNLDPQLPKSIWYYTNAAWLGFRVVRPLKQPTLEEMHRAWNTGSGLTE